MQARAVAVRDCRTPGPRGPSTKQNDEISGDVRPLAPFPCRRRGSVLLCGLHSIPAPSPEVQKWLQQAQAPRFAPSSPPTIQRTESCCVQHFPAKVPGFTLIGRDWSHGLLSQSRSGWGRTHGSAHPYLKGRRSASSNRKARQKGDLTYQTIRNM
ncbi:hypothetical protein HJG60_010051 [Phyllostomus discolor]|uniref:Uncharacterized protein n=1 Tax=Phyllostomus discolor TaxID=89673 RepID=A0A834AW12_9CHIR|nr:hypothetical protein HJG60_010051 [Phyllostomus discolor]